MGDWWQRVGDTVAEEFSDLPDAARLTRITVRLGLAAILGGVLGFERERSGKSAGLRTHMLVALGSALFVLIPQQAGMTDSDLSRVLFEHEYLPRAVAPEVLAANERSYEARLASTGMVACTEDPTPTVVGVLALGKTPRNWVPGAYLQFLRIRGLQWGDPVVDAQEIEGTLEQVLRRLDDKIQATLTVAIDFTSGPIDLRSTPYPLSALQQLSRNAVMHRSYEGTNAPVRVYWFDDRIEIINPGGPYGSVTAQNFGSPGVSDYRNPNIASVLKTLGFVQRFGFGIAEARRALHANGNPELEFQVQASSVLAIVRQKRYSTRS